MARTKHTGDCHFEPAKRGDFEACTRPGCTERFPCAGNTCGHLDCHERRGKPPKCHFCGKIVEGPRNEETSSWATGAVHGHSRTFHYDCRDKQASPADRARTGATFNPT